MTVHVPSRHADGMRVASLWCPEIPAPELVINFTVPGQAVPKERPRLGRGHHFYTPQKTKDYEAHVGACAMKWASFRAQPWPTDRFYILTVNVYHGDDDPRDLDNIVKSICDGLNKVLWDDDRQVKEMHVMDMGVGANPRVDIRIVATAYPYVGKQKRVGGRKRSKRGASPSP